MSSPARAWGDHVYQRVVGYPLILGWPLLAILRAHIYNLMALCGHVLTPVLPYVGMLVLTCSSLKGGVGKTTIAVNLGGALQDLQERCAVVDVDPQGSAARWAPEGVNVVTVDNAKSARAVKAKLAELAAGGTTVAILDTPPELEERALVAAMLSDVVLVPVTPSALDLWAAEAAVGTARDARAVRDNGRPLVAMVPAMLVHNRLSAELPDKLEEFGELVAPGIGQRTAVAEAVLTGQTVTAYAPSSPAAAEFRALAHFIKSITP